MISEVSTHADNGNGKKIFADKAWCTCINLLAIFKVHRTSFNELLSDISGSLLKIRWKTRI